MSLSNREWKEFKLSDIIEIIGGGTPKTTIKEYWNGDIPWLSVTDFNNGKKYCFDAEKKITEKGLNESSTKILKKGQIIISARGTVGVIAMLGRDMAFNQSNYGINAKPDLSENEFIYYLLKYNIPNFLSNSYGAVFDTITKETFQQIDILLPSLTEQKAIAGVLSSMDDKIDLLHRQNKTLEAMAETLFRRWFVEEAERSDNGKFDLWISETIGGDWGKDNPTGDFNYPVYCIRGTDIADLNNGLARKIPLRYVKEKKYKNVKPNEGDLIFEISGGTENQSTGRVTYINLQVEALFDYSLGFSNFCRLLKLKNQNYSFFVYSYLQYLYKQDEFFNLENGSSGIKNLNYKALLFELEYPMPKESIVLEYQKSVEVYFNKINQNKSQIRTLEKLRDTLLPKLMSGEVRVNPEGMK